MASTEASLNQAFEAGTWKFRPWREVSVFGAMLMGLSWGIPWFRALTQATNALSTGYAFLVLGGMMYGSYWIVRLMNALRIKISLRRGLMVLLMVASIFLGLKALLFIEESVTLADLTDRQLRSFADAYALIPDEFIITIAVLIVWRRGTQLATEKIGPRLVQTAFGVGIVMFYAFVFLNTFITGETLGSMPALFLFAGLMAMGAARVSVISTLRGGRDSPFDRRWLTGLFLSVAGAVGLASWLGAEMGGGEGVLGLLPRFIVGTAIALSLLLLTPVFVLLYWALFTFVTVSASDNLVTNRVSELIGQLQGAANEVFTFLDPYLGPLADFLARFGILTKALILWLIVLVMFLLVILAVYIQDSRRRARLREQYERLAEQGLWNTLRDTLRRSAREAGQSLKDLLNTDRRRRILAAARVRRIYSELMELCERMNHPRPDAATPREFLPDLAELFPGNQEDVARITRAYQQVRYGELPENMDEVQALEKSWSRIQAQVRLKST